MSNLPCGRHNVDTGHTQTNQIIISSTNTMCDIWYVLIYVYLGREESTNWLFDLCYTFIILKIKKIRSRENWKLLDLEFQLRNIFYEFPIGFLQYVLKDF